MPHLLNADVGQYTLDADAKALLADVPTSRADEVAQLIRERDSLRVLHEALLEVEHAAGLEDRLRVFVEAVRRLGFGRAVIVLRDRGMNGKLMVCAGLSGDEEAVLRDNPVRGAVWRRRLRMLERFRVSQSFYLEGRDPWVIEEFAGGVPSALPSGPVPVDGWDPGDMLFVPLRGPDGAVIATLALDDPADRRRPSESLVRTVELFGRQVVHHIEQARLAALAERRAERLQRLHEVGTTLARSLDEGEILRELARQMGRVVALDGVVIAQPDLDAGTVRTAIRQVRGVDRPRPPAPLGDGVVAEVARTGRAVRIDAYDAERSELAARDDLVGDGGPAASVLAVPLRLGRQLVGVLAVHSSLPAAYGAEDEELLRTISAQAATALANARLYAESEAERRQSDALVEVARAVGESLRPGEVLRLILRHTTALLRAKGACVALSRDDYLHVVAAVGSVELVTGTHFPIESTMMGRALREGVPVISNDVGSDPHLYRHLRRMTSIDNAVLVPLVTSQGAIGVIAAMDRDGGFGEADARILQRLADHVAVAIVNARLFEEVAGATREWKVAFDTLASGMAVLDEQGRIVRCNARAVELADAGSFPALLGREFHEAVLGAPAPDDGLLRRAIERQETGGDTLTNASRNRVFELLAAPHPNGGAVVSFDDVTAHQTLAERYRRVVDTAIDAIVMTDQERRVTFANAAAHTLFGRDTLVGTLTDDLMSTAFVSEGREHARRARAGEPQQFECAIRRPDGELRLASVASAPIYEVGQVTGVVASMRDVTDERRARDAVADSERRYRSLFEQAFDAIYTLDRDRRFTSANDATCRLLGLDHAQVLGSRSDAHVAADDADDLTARFAASLRGEPQLYECRLRRADGTHAQLSVTETALRHGDEVVGVLGVARDVSFDRERADALERSEARYTRLVEAASDAIFTVDEEGCFTAVNRALEVSLGRTRQQLIGTHFTNAVDERERPAMWQLLVQTLHGARTRRELRYTDAAGRERRGSIVATPILEHGRVMGALGIARDVTEERALTEQLVQQEKLVAVGQLVSGVAHELNNPLAGVLTFAELLLEAPPDDPELHEAARTIYTEAKRAARIVSNLLTFARQHAPERASTDLNRVLLDALELRRYSLRVQQVDIVLDLDYDLPCTWADPFQLQQVFLNLIANAEHALGASPADRRLTVRTRRRGGLLEAIVEDSGPGIPADQLERIFNPFYTTKPTGQGTGLGLSISDGIVKQHGGRLRAESAAGAGATFVLELPLVAPPATPRAGADADDAPAHAHEPALPPATMSGRMVLVVDDEPAIRGAVARYLRTRGHTVALADSGAAALAVLAERPFDAVLLDLRMLDMSGDAVYAELVRRDPRQAERVAFLSGDVKGSGAHAFVETSGRPWLAKPFLLDELSAMMEPLLETPYTR
jgi:PAS domain S-box-containing protein